MTATGWGRSRWTGRRWWTGETPVGGGDAGGRGRGGGGGGVVGGGGDAGGLVGIATDGRRSGAWAAHGGLGRSGWPLGEASARCLAGALHERRPLAGHRGGHGASEPRHQPDRLQRDSRRHLAGPLGAIDEHDRDLPDPE